MRFYRANHRYYCGVDLHARTMYLYLMDGQGTILLHERIDCTPAAFLEAVEPYTDDLVVCACGVHLLLVLAHRSLRRARHHFHPGHALYRKLIHGAKTKNDRVESEKLVVLLRGGAIP